MTTSKTRLLRRERSFLQ